MSVEVFELRLNDAPGEIWYGVRVNGRSLEAGWADPAAAQRRGEEYARELRNRGRGGTVETETPQTPTIPEPDVEPEEPTTEPETEPEETNDEED